MFMSKNVLYLFNRDSSLYLCLIGILVMVFIVFFMECWLNSLKSLRVMFLMFYLFMFEVLCIMFVVIVVRICFIFVGVCVVFFFEIN